MKFYDMNIRLQKIDDFEEVVGIARRLGYSGLGIVERYANLDLYKKIEKKSKELKDFRVVPGIEIEADGVKELKREINKANKVTDFIVVSGGKYKINRAAAEDKRVSILSKPEYKRSDSGIDHIIARFAAQNSVTIELNFHEILKTFRKIRSFVLNHMAKNIELANKFNTDIIITSGSRKKWDMRDPRQLASIGQILGMSLEDSMNSVSSIPEKIIGGAE